MLLEVKPGLTTTRRLARTARARPAATPVRFREANNAKLLFSWPYWPLEGLCLNISKANGKEDVDEFVICGCVHGQESKIFFTRITCKAWPSSVNAWSPVDVG